MGGPIRDRLRVHVPSARTPLSDSNSPLMHRGPSIGGQHGHSGQVMVDRSYGIGEGLGYTGRPVRMTCYTPLMSVDESV